MNAPVAVVRGVPESFAAALVRGDRPVIDVGLARRQHAAYVAALRSDGYTILEVDPDEDHPDCPFVEDTAVVLDHAAVVTRPGAPQRRGEGDPVATLLGNYRPLRRIEAPATLDGGDVLVIGRTVFVGRSSRTNDAGIEQLAAIASEAGYRTTPVDVARVLHLKSAVSVLDDDTLLVTGGAVDALRFSGMRMIEKAPGEAHPASTLRLGGGRLLVTASATSSIERLVAAGYDVEPIDVSQFQLADGGLTCLSILVQR